MNKIHVLQGVVRALSALRKKFVQSIEERRISEKGTLLQDFIAKWSEQTTDWKYDTIHSCPPLSQ